jgi:hypothetical protein
LSTLTKLIVVASLLVAVFLVSFLPPYLNAKRLNTQVENLNHRVELAELSLSAARMFLEVARNNFGIASQEASKFFGEVRRIADQTSNTKLKEVLESIASRRDAVTAGLAKADPAVRQQVQDLTEIALRLTP